MKTDGGRARGGRVPLKGRASLDSGRAAVWILDDEIMRFSREGFRNQANGCTFTLPMCAECNT